MTDQASQAQETAEDQEYIDPWSEEQLQGIRLILDGNRRATALTSAQARILSVERPKTATAVLQIGSLGMGVAKFLLQAGLITDPDNRLAPLPSTRSRNKTPKDQPPPATNETPAANSTLPLNMPSNTPPAEPPDASMEEGPPENSEEFRHATQATEAPAAPVATAAPTITLQTIDVPSDSTTSTTATTLATEQDVQPDGEVQEMSIEERVQSANEAYEAQQHRRRSWLEVLAGMPTQSKRAMLRDIVSLCLPDDPLLRSYALDALVELDRSLFVIDVPAEPVE